MPPDFIYKQNENIKNETKILANIETVIQQEELKQGMANTSLIDDPLSILLILLSPFESSS